MKTTLSENLESFIHVLHECNVVLEGMCFETFDMLFGYLNTLNIQMNIVIDEYPYLKVFEKSEYVDSIFQKIIDNRLSNVNFILSGSHIETMRDLLKHDNALYGRFTTQIYFEYLNYLEASIFYPNYSINDNLMRFYYSYIYKKESMLEVLNSEMFYCKVIEPSIKTFTSYRFEDIVKKYLILNNDGSYIDIGTYYYDDPKSKKNGEFDVVVQTKLGYIIYEKNIIHHHYLIILLKKN